MTAFRIFCDDAELAVELAREAEGEVRPELAEDPIGGAERSARAGEDVAVALATSVAPDRLVGLAHASRATGRAILLCLVGDGRGDDDLRDLAADLGLVVVSEVGPLRSAMALVHLPVSHPWTASTRRLQALDRIRLGSGATTGGRGGGHLLRADGGLLGWAAKGAEPTAVLGRPRDVGEALRALQLRTVAAPPARAVIEGVDGRAVREVLFGPPRALSDPASKTALDPYGLPLPLEELCSSPSRAASEAARIGFPVRISLASPDLRLWDHADLAVDGVDNAARVRDVYRQIMAMASERQPDARLLGVHVTATTRATALLRVRARPLPGGYVHAAIGFADPHGRASGDRTETVLPAGPEAIERVLARLSGADLLLAGPPAHRRASVQALSDVLLRLAAFVDDLRDEVEQVELHPLALLVGGTTEVREACITVGDAFLRSLEAPRETGT